jgi:uncharacterized membrane protein YfcA
MVWMGFPIVLWCAVFLALMAVVLLSRIGERLRWHVECQLAFMLVMLLVGFMTILSLRVGSWDWVIGCVTLAGMVVGTSMDVGSAHRDPVF